MSPSREPAPKTDRRSRRLRQADELSRARPIIGWREWLGLPELGIDRIKAKIDTGARSCALHAFDLRPTQRDGEPTVRFKVHPFQRDNQSTAHAEGTLIDWRWVKSSAGQETLRPVIETTIELMGRRWPIELTLINRDPMGFRMLLGRQALRRRFVVDPGRSFCAGRRPSARRRTSKKGTARKSKSKSRARARTCRANRNRETPDPSGPGRRVPASPRRGEPGAPNFAVEPAAETTNPNGPPETPHEPRSPMPTNAQQDGHDGHDDGHENPPRQDPTPKDPRRMKIAILSRNKSLYSTRRLAEAAEQRGHEVHVIDYLRCYMDITSHRPSIIYGGKRLSSYDAVIPRIGASHTFYGTAVVRQFEMMNVFCVNESQAIQRSRDKLRSLQLLSRRGIGLPVTAFAHSTKDADGIIDTVGGAPLVIKLLEGTQGMGVVLAETRKAAQSVIEAFRNLDAYILVQEFIKEAGGADIRCFVVGGKVIAAMKRQGGEGEFRSNIHRGGSASKIKITPEERSTAVRAAKAMGLNVAGVDLLRANHGPVVMEVNSSPGLEGIEGATELDVSGRICSFIEKNAAPGKTRDKIKKG